MELSFIDKVCKHLEKIVQTKLTWFLVFDYWFDVVTQGNQNPNFHFKQVDCIITSEPRRNEP